MADSAAWFGAIARLAALSRVGVIVHTPFRLAPRKVIAILAICSQHQTKDFTAHRVSVTNAC